MAALRNSIMQEGRRWNLGYKERTGKGGGGGGEGGWRRVASGWLAHFAGVKVFRASNGPEVKTPRRNCILFLVGDTKSFQVLGPHL